MSLVITPLVGGTKGTGFNDVEKLMKDGELVIDFKSPIRQIQVRAGWVVDGIQVAYQDKYKGTNLVTCTHGSKTEGNPQTHTINIKPTEKLISVFGRAGEQSYYKRKLINCIGFVIFDKQTAKTRVEGPFGNENGSNNGQAFHVEKVVAMGGFAEDGASQCGLSGLYFALDASTSLVDYNVQV